MGLIETIKIWLGYEICPRCGSERITKHGFEGANLRFSCQACGAVTRII